MWNPIAKIKEFFVRRTIKKAIGGEMLGKIIKLLDGNKTYIVMILGGIIGIMEAKGIQIPEYVYVILGSLGLGAVRSAIGKVESK